MAQKQASFSYTFVFYLLLLKVLNNKAYRPNAHLLYTVMHYNGNII